VSQAGIINTTGGGGSPPDVPTQFTTNDGIAVPVANNLNIFAEDSTQNDDNGITTEGAGDTVTILITNRLQNSGTTNGAVNLDLISFSLGATPANYIFEIKIAAFSPLNNVGGGWSLFGTVRTDGATATQIETEDKINNKDALIATADVNFATSGNSFVLRVTGSAGITDLNWSAVGLYTRVT